MCAGLGSCGTRVVLFILFIVCVGGVEHFRCWSPAQSRHVVAELLTFSFRTLSRLSVDTQVVVAFIVASGEFVCVRVEEMWRK